VQLRRRELAVENEGVGVAHERRHFEIGHFAAAQDKARVHLAHALDHASADGDAGCGAEFGKFVQVAFLYGSGFGRHGDDDGPGFGLRLARAVRAAEFLFQGQGRIHEIRLDLIPGPWRLDHVGRRCLGRHKVPALPLHGIAERIHRQGDDAVEAQEEHVHEVFLAEQIGREMRMQEAQAAEAGSARARALQRGNVDAVGLADDDHVHAAAAVDEQADLPAQSAREQGDFSRLLYAVNVMFRELALGQPVECLELARLQPLKISVNMRNGAPPKA